MIKNSINVIDTQRRQMKVLLLSFSVKENEKKSSKMHFNI